MTSASKFTHLIPQIGEVEIDLYEPACSLFSWLDKQGEPHRLSQLRHSGVVAEVLRGMAHYRWDYTVAMLYYTSRISAAGLKSRFRIGACQFSSQIAALQCAALVWNIGHLPGTYPIEKGAYRFLRNMEPSAPASSLDWPVGTWYDRASVVKAANALLGRDDYLAMARVLAALKLLSFSDSTGEQRDLVKDFLIPFLLQSDADGSMQWPKLRRCFGLIRHLSYLTIDSIYAGAVWIPNMSLLIDDLRVDGKTSVDLVADELSEILSPVERQTFSRLYHNDRAKAEAARHSDRVERKLQKHRSPHQLIHTWSFKGLKRDLKLGTIINRERLHHVGAVALRSHFSGTQYTPVELERRLQDRGFSHPIVFRYKSWNSEVLLEPDELTIDVYQDRSVQTKDIGRFVLWVMRRFDDLSADPSDFFGRAVKMDLAHAYERMLRHAVCLRFPGASLDVEPWPLERFGIFEDSGMSPNKNAVWACAAKLDDPFSKHILRNRTRSIPTAYRALYHEMSGIRELRKRFRTKWTKNIPRQRWLMVTGSVRILDHERTLAEFDGGLVRLSARSGEITWYGLEAKKGRRGAVSALNKKLKVLGLPETAKHIGSSAFSFATIKL